MAFYIQNVKSELVLDIKGASREPHAEVLMYKPGKAVNQMWEYTNGMIYSQMHRLVLDVDPVTNGIIVNTPAPLGLKPSQKWYFDEDSTLRNGEGKVIDIQGGKLKSGAAIIAYAKHGGVNQLFKRKYL